MYLSTFILMLLCLASISADIEYGTANCATTDCSSMASCQHCTYDDCNYGEMTTAQCTFNSTCRNDPQTFEKNVECRYCQQTESSEHVCVQVRNCSTRNRDQLVITTCHVRDHVYCMGPRAFTKRVPCDWTSGHRWSTAMILSVTLGGFGVDRFYLGLWQSAIGKLVSFGGLGVWTLIDVILMAAGYITPADGSILIY